MRVGVCLGAILIAEYLDFHFGYSAPRSRIAGIYSGIYSGIYPYSGISQTNAPLEDYSFDGLWIQISPIRLLRGYSSILPKPSANDSVFF